MVRRSKLKVAALTAGVVFATSGVLALPALSAANCTITVVLNTGQTLHFQLPSTALPSTLAEAQATFNLPEPPKTVTESCPSGTTIITAGTTTTTGTSTTTPTTSTTTPTTSTTTPTTSTSSTSTSTSTSSTTTTTTSSTSTSTTTTGTTTTTTGASTTPKKPGGKGKPSSSPQSKPANPKPKPKRSKRKPKSKPAAKPKPKSAPQPQATPSTTTTSTGTTSTAPALANPAFSFTLPSAPVGVPNFFIDSFRIPPFLLPIYQAAGIEYDVPWQVLAAINEVETDYGRNLSVSTAGAVGWMQFLPSTWTQWRVDANGDGVADPYNPVDAIFTAARYLQAAGASTNLAGAIYAYNHASWYVQSVLLRAKLIGGMPDQLVGALAGLVEGHFPVAAPAKYADDAVQQLATTKVGAANAAIPVESDPNSTAVSIHAKRSSPVIAVNDGKIVAVGHTHRFGNYIELQDATGNVYTYAQLGSIPSLYPVPKVQKVTAAEIARQLSLPTKAAAPTRPATAGTQPNAPTVSSGKASQEAQSAARSLPVSPHPAANTITAPMAKERLFAYPSRPASFAAGGDRQIKSTAPQITSFGNYFSDVLHLARNQYTLKPLEPGAIVVAGTIIGRVGAGTPTDASHLDFLIRPAGKNAPYIDPKPILDGWKLLAATAVYRAAGADPFFGPNAKNPSVGQVLLMSKQQLTDRILADPRVQIYACGRRDIQAGLIDRRVLATVEFLAASGLDPTVSGLECGHSLTTTTGVDAAGATGSSVDISAINNIPVSGHQGPGSVTDMTIRRLLTLQGAMKPDEIVSLMSYKGQSNTLSLPDHADRIQIAFTPLYGQNKRLSAEITSALQPNQWIQLIDRLNQIPEPVVPISPSRYAIKVSGR